jgi:putative hemolysin
MRGAALLAVMHIIDELIIERAPRLAKSWVWPLVRPVLYALLGYHKARAMADVVVTLPGAKSLDYVSDLLHLTIKVSGLDRVPKTGRCVVVVNHPTGIADGLAVYDALKAVRPDQIYFANADALRVSARLGEVVIPVEWVESKRTREKTRDTLLRAKEAFEAERCVVVFPAGRLARKEKGVLTDEPWATSALSLARKYGAPVIPIHLEGPDSVFFHAFDAVSHELRDITLFHEMLNKEGKTFRLTIGKPIPSELVDADATEAVKTYVERNLPFEPDRPYQP